MVKKLLLVVSAMLLYTTILISSELATIQMFIIREVRGERILYSARNIQPIKDMLNGLSAQGIPKDSLFFLVSWQLSDTVGGELVIVGDSLFNHTFVMRTVYDDIELNPIQ